MTNSASHSPSVELESCCTFQSSQAPGVVFTIRRMTLKQRINLLQELHGHYRDHEFSAAGTSKADRLQAQLSSLRIDEVFLRWGLTAITGLYVDGKAVSVDEVTNCVPECLANEILGRIRETVSLSQGEEKN